MFGRGRNKENKETGKNWTDKAAGKLAGAGLRLQSTFADYMNKQTSRLPQRKLKFGLALFCLLAGGFSIYLAVYAVVGTESQQPAFKIQPVEIPRYYDRNGGEVNEAGNYVDESLYREIQEYKRHMDSLGHPIRPGLSDSIRILEQLYHSQ